MEDSGLQWLCLATQERAATTALRTKTNCIHAHLFDPMDGWMCCDASWAPVVCVAGLAAPVAGARRMCVARDGTAKPSGEIKRAIRDLKLSSELWGHSVGLAGSELESESDRSAARQYFHPARV